MFSDLTWKKMFVPGNGGGAGAPLSPFLYVPAVIDYRICRLKKRLPWGLRYNLEEILLIFSPVTR